ncbi:hypothetical protein DEU56DRAFT_144764 [Suillus clintonianus]|uniref:uncharacterized protein n=1 Tax=Suillus clintonianus TaxID=1904413 RepID=UPI001B85E5D6|nr:uncharacterized protein DEU56DRAFT_144764 [Suillus clintonianus]KAG2118377.1 hypothetical protein DEU56DRAFT_144764 [Suillus clintonianus]
MTVFLAYVPPSSIFSLLTYVMQAEIPGQDQDGYDAEPDFFRGMDGHSQISRPQPQQRPGRFKKLRLAMTRNPHPVPPPAPAPAPTPAPPIALPPPAAPTTFTAHVRHLFTWRPDHAAPPVVEVPFAWGRKRNAAAGAPPDDDSDIIRAEYFDDDPQHPNAQQPNVQQPNTQQPDTQQQRQPVAIPVDTGVHGVRKSCFCC